MNINANFDTTVVVHAQERKWIASPMQGVERKMLDRVGNEVARATSIVRYAPGSQFSPHVHNGGEEFVVLTGVFQDEHGDYPVGTYMRNPPQSSHTPGSEVGCTIFVKLWQFDPNDQHQMAAKIKNVDQSHKQSLFESKYEQVFCVTLRPNEVFAINHHKGIEIFMLHGEADLQSNTHAITMFKFSWLRKAVDEPLVLTAKTPVRLWLKQNHLHDVEKQLERVLCA
ncbi:hypothetical protein GPUN_0655 [Glaciecola punicea ACAM 611]|jgi:anti-sigma factor ChrR (cupin superfamily)|uniref:ChrR-like cupin domain-containing protein n=1 Tax=Glaciecola punicea ACAM 611 TaxID=1121923 RepID=H5T918_9ALTE|nr:cupin domain-containing protein [Glaciecola punicea]OFA31680.1 cupin [Glaciecola punicea]GAB54795.1 hypothetical protein GPUN_0655 [Glaciecola punicea ACAM 611]